MLCLSFIIPSQAFFLLQGWGSDLWFSELNPLTKWFLSFQSYQV